LLEEVGLGEIEADLIAKRRWLVGQLQGRGMEVLNPAPAGPNEGALVTFGVPGRSSVEVQRILQESRFVVSLRHTRDGRDWIRVSAHYYNTMAELERFIEALPAHR
jgi:selenocysteine lyase/cysteine desulfurase